MIYSPSDIPTQWIVAIAVAVLVAVIVSVVVFYLVTRLRFAFFHCLIHNTSEIRPGWEIYRTQALRFFWLNLGVGFCFLLLAGLLSIPFIAGFWRVFHETPPGGHPDIGLLISLVLPLIPIILLLVLVGVAADVILRDWMLPHFALEDASAGEAWEEVWARMRAEQRQFLVYGLLRLILPVIAMIAVFTVLLIPGFMLAGVVAAFEYGIHSAFADATGASSFVGVALEVFFGVIAFGFMVLASICLGGPISTAVREYAITFYGGRYQALGEILDPQSTPAPGA